LVIWGFDTIVVSLNGARLHQAMGVTESIAGAASTRIIELFARVCQLSDLHIHLVSLWRSRVAVCAHHDMRWVIQRARFLSPDREHRRGTRLPQAQGTHFESAPVLANYPRCHVPIARARGDCGQASRTGAKWNFTCKYLNNMLSRDTDDQATGVQSMMASILRECVDRACVRSNWRIGFGSVQSRSGADGLLVGQ